MIENIEHIYLLSHHDDTDGQFCNFGHLRLEFVMMHSRKSL